MRKLARGRMGARLHGGVPECGVIGGGRGGGSQAVHVGHVVQAPQLDGAVKRPREQLGRAHPEGQALHQTGHTGQPAREGDKRTQGGTGIR